MTRSFQLARCLTVGAASSRGRLLPVLLMLALAFPSTAHPCTLEQLLRMPLERLLQLEISPRRISHTAVELALTLASGQPAGSRRAA